MPPAGGPTGPRQTSDGPPSEQARAALAERLRREVADARLRLEEAGLRAEAHRLLGQHDAAAEVLREQDQVLADLQDRLARTVSAAVVERDAEQVLADLVATEPVEPVADDPVRPAPPVRLRTPVLAGVSSLVAVLGLAAAAILGLDRGLGPVELTEAAADSTPEEQASDGEPLAGPTPAPSVSVHPGGGDGGPATRAPSPERSSASPAGPTESTTEDDTADPTPSPSPTPEPGLATVVQELIDAVDGLDDPDVTWGGGQLLPDELTSSIPRLEEVVDQLVGGEGETDDPEPDAGGVDRTAPRDGFVPRRPAE